MKTPRLSKQIGLSLSHVTLALALVGCSSTAERTASEQRRNSERQARSEEKERRAFAEKERRTAEAQKHWQEVLAPLSNEQLRFKLAGLEQAIARGTDGMNILLQQGNGIGALIAQGQIEAKVKERDAVGMELARRAPVARSDPPSVKPDGDGPARIKGSGSGFFITGNGHFVTCAHVVGSSTKVAICTKAGTFLARVLRVDEANDVAVLKADGLFPALSLVSSGSILLGERVFTIGFPKPGLQGFEPKYTSGDISALTGFRDNPQTFQISVPVQPGNSGGVLVNKDGAAIGVVASKLNGAENVNYAVKSSHVLTLLESLPGVSNQLRKPPSTQERKQEEVIKEVEGAVGLVLVF
jgi:S1-C subfamily serine protease